MKVIIFSTVNHYVCPYSGPSTEQGGVESYPPGAGASHGGGQREQQEVYLARARQGFSDGALGSYWSAPRRPSYAESSVGLQRRGEGPGAMTQIRQSAISSGKRCETNRTDYSGAGVGGTKKGDKSG